MHKASLPGDDVSTKQDVYDTRPARSWLIVLPTAGLVVGGLLWSAFWYFASTKAETTMSAWRAREAQAGRVYGCGDASFGGYPFRIEVACANPSVDDRGAALSMRARNLRAVAQVWDPTLVLGEIDAPMTLAPYQGAPFATLDWVLAQASLRGAPGTPDEIAMVVDKPRVTAGAADGNKPLVQAQHGELHARFATDSTPRHPVLDVALDLTGFTAAPMSVSLPAPLRSLASATTDASIFAVLRGATDLGRRPIGEELRQFQAGNGRLDITNARFQQGDIIATANGSVALTPRGTLTGQMQVTVVNFAKLMPLLGVDRALAQFVPPETLNRFAPSLDRLVPGLGNALRSVNSNAGSNADALGTGALGGRQSELDGQRAVTLTLRFDDGVVLFGPLKLGEIGPLY
jgi:hypothetical protein